MGRARGRLTWSEWLTTLLPHTTLHFTSQGTGASQTLRSLESRACKGKGVGGWRRSGGVFVEEEVVVVVVGGGASERASGARGGWGGGGEA